MRIPTIAVLSALALFAFAWRVVPHEFNMTPMAALAIFAGAKLRSPQLRIAVPLIVMVASDLILGFHATMPFVYGSFAVIALGAVWLKQRGVMAHGAGAVVASLLFYLVTNFGAWLLGDLYTHDPAGLLASYVAGLPFLAKSLAGNVFFTWAFLAVFLLVEKYETQHQRQRT